MKNKLALVTDISSVLEKEGVAMTPNAIRARLKSAMLRLAEESCHALGADVEKEELERIAGSRAFHEAVASLLAGDDHPQT